MSREESYNDEFEIWCSENGIPYAEREDLWEHWIEDHMKRDVADEPDDTWEEDPGPETYEQLVDGAW